MRIKKIVECERKQLEKFRLLPHIYKNIGIAGTLVAISGLIINYLFVSNSPSVKMILFNILLVSMLLISISKDAFEDEYNLQLRNRSYTLAFIFGVIYALIQPHINFVVSALLKEDPNWAPLPSFSIIWFMLFIQIGFFHLFKKIG